MNWLSRIIFRLAASAIVVFIAVPAFAQGENPPIKIRVASILATNSPLPSEKDAARERPFKVDMDPRLKQINLAGRLTMMFSYSSYHLLRHQEDKTSLGNAVAFNLPGSHILHVCPLGFQNNVLIVLLQMFEGERMMMRMPMRMMDDAVLMLVDEHSDNQYYITAISADTPPYGGPSKIEIPVHQVPPMPTFPLLVPAE